MTPDFLMWSVVLLLSVATYRLCRLFIEDAILEGFRERVWKRFPPETSKIGYLLTCYWCLSVWFAGFLVVLYLLAPVVAIPLAMLLTISAIVGFVDHLMNR